jgi:hypothetical protein
MIIFNDIEYILNDYGEDSVIFFDTPHSCYSHAIFDSFFSYFWILEDIKEKYNIIPDIIIKNKYLEIYPNNYKNIINNEYIGIYKELFRLITDKQIFFQYNIDTISYKDIFIPAESYQRTPWNSSNYYPNRENISIHYDNSYIKIKLLSYRNHILTKYNLLPNNSKNILLIDRNKKNGRNISEDIKKQILYYGYDYNCKLVYLEGLTFQEQVILFSQYNIFIFVHGSGAANLLFAPLGSICFELDTEIDRDIIYKRICDLLEHKYYLIKYNNKIDVYKEIFSVLIKLI